MAEPTSPASAVPTDSNDEVIASIDESMSDDGDIAEAKIDENGDQPMEDDDAATASEEDDDDVLSTTPPANGNGPTIMKKPSSRPLPSLKLSLNSKKSITGQGGMRIKLKLPTQANMTGAAPPSPDDTAARLQKGGPSKKPPIISKQATGSGSRRRPVVPSKQVRLPPIASPGLVLPGKPMAASVFDSVMGSAGYTDQQRASQPHRGSSVRRTVGDLFDTDTQLALHRIELAPPELTAATKTNDKGETKPLTTLLTERLAGRKRPRAASLRGMVPVSLTIPYPESYKQEFIKYRHKVNEREHAIVEWQEAAEMIEELDSDDKNPVVIPDIPQPPEPPKLSELDGYKSELTDQRHPLYIPTSKDGTPSSRVAHLDLNCFHITQGRYFGLASNNINDPQVYGPNAPGCSGTSGVATATTSTTTSTSGLSGGGMTLILSAGFHCAAAVPLKEAPSSVTKPAPTTTSSSKPAGTTATTTTTAASAVSVVEDILASSSSTTENSNALRLIMMDATWADSFRVAIWKAAVHACRTQKYDTPFTGPNGHVYPDLGRAFSSYALIKPCTRCKNNKQGVYHCRVRRKHREADFDGEQSVESLAQYEKAPLESLLETAKDSP